MQDLERFAGIGIDVLNKIIFGRLRIAIRQGLTHGFGNGCIAPGNI